MKPFRIAVLAFCLGAGLLTWWHFDDTHLTIDQPETEKAEPTSTPFVKSPAPMAH